MTWRLARSLEELRRELDAKYPRRDHASDGTIGDARHRAESHSDHNPNAAGVVRAFDIDVDGIPAAQLAERFRQLGAAGDRRLNPAGYVILNRRIASAVRGWAWHTYTGSDPHTSHIHLSVSSAPGGYDLGTSWPVFPGTTAPAPRPAVKPQTPAKAHADRALKVGDTDLPGKHDVSDVQRALVKAGQRIAVDGRFGPGTELALRAVQRSAGGIPVTGRVDAQTWQLLRTIAHGR